MVIPCTDPRQDALRAFPPTPRDLPTVTAVMGRASGENFTVASRLLDEESRERLMAFYGYARLVDELGDSYRGDRVAALEWVRSVVADPHRADLSVETAALVVEAVKRAEEARVGRAPLLDLIEANLMDQATDVRCADWAQLMDYCRYSANPVGRLVLAAFGADGLRMQRLSDQVCSGLQVVEHMQDLREDALVGRVYLPAADLAWAGSDPSEVIKRARSGAGAGPAIATAVARQLERAVPLLQAGGELAGLLPRRPGLAVASFAAGGLATVDAISRHGWDTLTHFEVRPAPLRTVVRAASLTRWKR